MNILFHNISKWVVLLSILPIALYSQFLYFMNFVGAAQACTGTGTANPLSQGRYICAEDALAETIVSIDCFVVSLLIVIVWLTVHHLKYQLLILPIRIFILLHLYVFRFWLIDWMHDTRVIPWPPQ